MDWPSFITLVGVIIAFCFLLDWFASKEEVGQQKLTIIRWWVGLDNFTYPEAVRKSNYYFVSLFNSIYGKRFVSFRCIFVSILLSIASVAVVWLLFLVIIDLHESVDEELINTSIFLNFPADYISLIETRIILLLLLRIKSSWILPLLIADIIISAAIFLGGGMLIGYISYIFCGKLSDVTYITESVFFSPRQDDIFIQMCFLSTFSTSVLFYLYSLSTILFKFIAMSKTRLMILLEKLEGSNQLFKSLGGFLAVLLGLIKGIVDLLKNLSN